MMLVLSSGSLFNTAGFDMSYLMGNSMTLTYSDNLAVYAYRYGMQMSRFSMSTSLSVFNSILSLSVVFIANFIASRAQKEQVL
jgi:putative aldouronate transport system permease protein